MRCLPLFLLALGAPVVAQDNVLMVVLDDVGVDHIGAYKEGVQSANTPVIDGLAADGVLFRNAWSNPCCSPTRATILTGRFGFRTGIGFVVSKQGYELPLDELILPEVFHGTGHADAGFGKWHLANRVGTDYQLHPNQSGFSHWAGNYNNLIPPQNYDWWVISTNGVLQHTTDYATTRTVDEFLEWHDQQSGPWFAYVALHAAHEPLHAPPQYLHTESLPAVDPRVRPRAFYRAAVEAADTELGRLLTSLGPDLANTNVIVLGDNGTIQQASTPPFEPSHAKLTPYEGGVNVPLIISGPAVTNRGHSNGLVNTTDLFATTIELAGYQLDAVLPPGHVHDSISLVPYLQDVSMPSLRPWAYSEMWKPNGWGNKNLDIRILRDDRYKIIRRGVDALSHEYEMYDLEADPFEADDLLEGTLSADEQARFDALEAALDALLATG